MKNKKFEEVYFGLLIADQILNEFLVLDEDLNKKRLCRLRSTFCALLTEDNGDD